ncbi:MAG: polyphosphate kinase 1 [Limnothrix sp. BL-A-16]|jgi:polyphosphate kinase
MTRAQRATTENPDRPESQSIDLQDPQYYFNRELSWIQFNRRVLHESMDDRNPLLERLKFSAIFSSNLDEFFMVRVAALKKQVEAGVAKRPPDGRSPQQQLIEIAEHLRPIVADQHQHYAKVLRPLLAEQGIYLLDYVDLNQEQRAYLHQLFEAEIFPVLTPLAVDPGHPFPHISNLSLNLAVVVQDPETQEDHFGRVKVPESLPRFLPLAADSLDPATLSADWVGANPGKPVWVCVAIEQVIAHNLESLFPGMNILEYQPFRVTRNADIAVAEDEADDLLLAIEQELRKRRLGGSVVRLEVLDTMPTEISDRLLEELEITAESVYPVTGLLGLRDFMAFLGLPLPHLKDPSWNPVIPKRVQRLPEPSESVQSPEEEEVSDFFTEIRRQDLLLHHPYHSFSATVQRFITEAARDPNVLTIKMTLYRTSGDSPIVHALIDAAENGKQVVVLVELKARFDEENNINWARKLESAGVHVVYGLVGLKTHTKIVLVVRKEPEGLRRYVHIGTGNYNPKTAKLYTDVGLLSCRPELGADLTDLFNYLTGYSRQRAYRKLLVAPVNMRDRMVALIQRERDWARQGQQGRVVAKMNALVDPVVIRALYEASQAGVQVDLIVRGICCLRPGLPGLSDHIRVVSIVGRFLEHSRIFYFHNGGQDELYIGSADWMPRNLTRRVEAVTPIEDPDLVQELQAILGVMLADTRNAWELQSDGIYNQRQPLGKSDPQASQVVLMQLAEQEAVLKDDD